MTLKIKDKITMPWIILGLSFLMIEICIFFAAHTPVIWLAATVANGCVMFLIGNVIYYGPKKILQVCRDQRKTTIFCVICILLSLVIAVRCFHNVSMSTLFGQYALLLQVFLLPVVLFGVFGIYVWKLDTWKLYLLIAILAGIGMMMMIPIGAAPDEIVHASSAYKVSNLFLGVHDSAEGVMMRADDCQFIITDLGRNSYTNMEAFEKYISYLLTPLQNGDMVLAKVATTGPMICYIVPAIGVTIGRLLNLGTFMTLLLGRLCNFALFITLTTYAVKKMPIGKLAMVVLLLMPMTVQQGMSFSYDSFIIGISMVITAYSVKIALLKEQENLSRKELIVLAVLSVLLFPLKGKAYFLISLLPWFVLLWKKHPLSAKASRNVKRTVLILIVVFAAAVLVWAKTGASSYQYTPNLLYMNNTLTVPLKGYSLSYFIANPLDIIIILMNTLSKYTSFYYYSFVGIMLAWLDMGIPKIFAVIYTVLLVLASFIHMGDDTVLPSHFKKQVLLVTLLTSGFIFAGMLFSWSPIAGQIIEGVQGRYFLPFALLVFLLLRTKKIQVDQSIDDPLKVVTLMTIFTVVEYICLNF